MDLIEEQDEAILRGAMRQIWLAKMFALLGWGPEANLLAETPTESLDQVSGAVKRSLDSRLRDHKEDRLLSREIVEPVELKDLNKAAFVVRRFRISLEEARIKALLDHRSLLDWLTTAPESAEEGWATGRTEIETTVRLPMGFEVSLETESIVREARES